jgi:hypothetical protein
VRPAIVDQQDPGASPAGLPALDLATVDFDPRNPRLTPCGFATVTRWLVVPRRIETSNSGQESGMQGSMIRWSPSRWIPRIHSSPTRYIQPADPVYQVQPARPVWSGSL